MLQNRVVFALVGESVAVALFTLLRLFRGGTRPWFIVVERPTALTIGTFRVVVADTDQLAVYVTPVATVSVAFHLAAHDKVRNRVIIRLEDFCSAKELVTECVQSNERNSNVRRRHEFLQNLRIFEALV